MIILRFLFVQNMLSNEAIDFDVFRYLFLLKIRWLQW